MSTTLRFTSADLDAMPDDGKRYEIVDGQLYVSRQPHLEHQFTCTSISTALGHWSRETGAGFAFQAPGLIFADDDDVAPDVVWVSRTRLSAIMAPDGNLHGAPELVVEVLSPGAANERRDRVVKLKLYSRRGVLEYWIADWQRRQVEVYCRDAAALHLVVTLHAGDTLGSPLLPGFACQVAQLFADWA
jgi:Uma2 family endonuclease